MFDAYTVKKVMPRLLIAAILIQLSWPLFTSMIFIVSQIAWGIEGLLYAPFGGREALNIGVLIGQAVNNGVEVPLGGLLAVTAAGGYAVALGPAGLLSLAITVILALLIAFFVLAIRQVVLVVLLVTAPLALVAWILPNTEKFWKIWWESFSKLLLMYPIILLLIAGGRVAAKIAADVAANSSANDGFGVAIVVLAFFAPFFLIPKTFQLAGSAFANIVGIANDRSRGAFDRLKGFRGNKMADNWQSTKGFSRFGGNNRFSRGMNTALGTAVTPRAWVGGKKSINAARETGRTLAGAAFMDSDPIFKANKNNDQFLLALANRKLAEEKLRKAEASGDMAQAAGYRQAIAQADMVANNNPASRMAALQSLAATGYQFDTGQAGYNQLAETVAGITGATLTRDAAGNITGATGQHAGDFAAAMNGAQYQLKGAGRFDLAGINYGAGYDVEAGMGKVDPYTMASRAKPDTIKAKGQMMRDAIDKAKTAAASGDAATYHTEMEKAQVHKLELNAALDSATGKNRDTILSQLESVNNDADLNNWVGLDTGQTQTKRVNYQPGMTGWTPEEYARGWRMEDTAVRRGDIAKQKARGARRPDNSELIED